MNYQLHVSAIAAVAIIRLDTIYQRSYVVSVADPMRNVS